MLHLGARERDLRRPLYTDAEGLGVGQDGAAERMGSDQEVELVAHQADRFVDRGLLPRQFVSIPGKRRTDGAHAGRRGENISSDRGGGSA